LATLSTLCIQQVDLDLYGTHARLTILKQPPNPGKSPSDPQALALSALGWILSDEDRASRFLGLTGLTPQELRASLDQPATLQAVIDHLCAHEPDLVGAAEAIGVAPHVLAQAREGLIR